MSIVEASRTGGVVLLMTQRDPLVMAGCYRMSTMQDCKNGSPTML